MAGNTAENTTRNALGETAGNTTGHPAGETAGSAVRNPAGNPAGETARRAVSGPAGETTGKAVRNTADETARRAVGGPAGNMIGNPAGNPAEADPVRQIVRAVLYEGYLLWPYRHSALKNRHRWTFGGLYPAAYAAAGGGDASSLRTECLIEAEPADTVDVTVCFLHAVTRRALGPYGEDTCGEDLCGAGPPGGDRPEAWEEATEREVSVTGLTLAALLDGPHRTELHVPAGRDVAEPADDLAAGPAADAMADGPPYHVLDVPVDALAVLRTWGELRGQVEIRAARAAEGVFRLTVEVANTTPWPGGSRAEAQRCALLSAHAVLRSPGGRFVSLTDPPPELREAAAACRNVGVWPVLAGAEGDRHTVLASPIILYDHPKIAPESPGDLFDATEIDQLLTLSVLALGEEEQREIRAGDPRAREILDRCAALTPEQLMRLHGTLREVRPLPGDTGTGTASGAPGAGRGAPAGPPAGNGTAGPDRAETGKGAPA